MKKDLKKEIKTRCCVVRGLANLLVDDVDYICADADRFDLFSIDNSIQEARKTIELMIETMAELEYAIYLKQNANSR